MTTDTRQRILSYIITNKQVRAHDLARSFNLTSAAIHRQLRRLLAAGEIKKTGTPPLVFYQPADSPKPTITTTVMDKKTRDILEKNYLYITPQGDLLYGAAGFDRWAANTNQSDKTVTLAKVYARTLANFNRHRAHQGWIDATLKVRSTFGESFLDKLLYADFYSLPQFGKTRLGSLVLYAKQSQNRALISLVCEQIKPLVNKIIDEYNVDAVAFIPPSVPRSVQFQTELAAGLNLALPVIDLVKARSGQVIVAQKTLEKLSERVTNARDSIFVRNKTVGYKNVLLIDDAVGSGASLNETAKKIRAGATGKIKVIGFAVVGSYQKFDVIREV